MSLSKIDEEFEVQGFDDYDYSDYYDQQTNSIEYDDDEFGNFGEDSESNDAEENVPRESNNLSLPKGVGAIPGIAELAETFPGGPKELQKVLNDPQVLDFITNNPDIVQKIVKEGLDPDKLQTLLALAGPPPKGAEQGIFGPNIFGGILFFINFVICDMYSVKGVQGYTKLTEYFWIFKDDHHKK